MIYGSVCSGIEAATVAWHGLGWKPAFFSEIEKFPRSVLAHHYPDTPLHGDFTTIGEKSYEPIDLLVGGTPCQSFSVAGLRKGLADERGNLTLEFIRLAERLKPRWTLWENVPGVLSQDKGRAFGSFLGGLAECGYGFAYRVLDAQYFGVPQRRRRVFVVGYLGDWRRAAAVLFERDSLQRDITPSREKREITSAEVAKCLTSRGAGGGNCDPETANFITDTLTSNGDAHSGFRDEKGLVAVPYGIDEECNVTEDGFGTLLKGGQGGTRQTVAYGIPGNWIGRAPENGGNATQPMNDLSPNLTGVDRHAVCYENHMQDSRVTEISVSPVISAKAGTGGGNLPLTQTGMNVRRLTPRECERLQGFPDNYTLLPNNKADGPRYKALGNSMAVPVMKWLGERIEMIERTNP